MSKELIVVLLVAPLVGFLINGLFGKWLKGKEKLSGGIGALAVLVSLVCSIIVFTSLNGGAAPLDETLYEWITGESFAFNIGFRVDALTAVMLLVITGVGFLIHVYSIGYMHGDEGYTRYFAYLNLFVFAMLILVLGNNYLMMFVGWEGVGLCSYLLIGFWYEKQTATDAGKKAFIVNRIGDFGFLLGMFTLFAAFGTLDFASIFNAAEADNFQKIFGASTLVIATLLLFVGAIGKSAQIPLYVWLPDAMEGPTPVSALIHAATMVTAGVYMIARSAVLYNIAHTGEIVAWIGVLTAFFAATIALTQNDIKRIPRLFHCQPTRVYVRRCRYWCLCVRHFPLSNARFFQRIDVPYRWQCDARHGERVRYAEDGRLEIEDAHNALDVFGRCTCYRRISVPERFLEQRRNPTQRMGELTADLRDRISHSVLDSVLYVPSHLRDVLR